MSHRQHIKEAFDLLGGASAVARHYGITPWAASKWADEVPPHRVISLAKLTGWVKRPHDLCPELYPNPWDGMPRRMSAKVRAAKLRSVEEPAHA